MKIAAITDDGKTISQHFGRAQYYLVATVENGVITAREMRPKLGHNHFSQSASGAEHVHVQEPGQGHGFDPASQDRHNQMAITIEDCEALLCRGMGRGAYVSMQALNITPVVTDIAGIEQAVLAYARGEIVDHTDRLH
jgi:predicted Fe-Mo cluster-binding NifX family protein